MSVEKLRREEIEQKAPVPTAEQIDRYYETNKTRHPALRGKTKDQALPEVEKILREQAVMQRTTVFIGGLRRDAEIKVLLLPPRAEVPVPKEAPSKGSARAPVTIVEFSDFQCGYCRRVYPTLTKLLEEYEGKVRLVYRDFTPRNHPRARPAAIAAYCAGDQRKYWEYHEDLMHTQGTLSDDDLKARAEKLGLNMRKFNACYDAGRHGDFVDAATQDGASLGVTGTPSFFVNGRMLVGAKPYQAFKEVIEE
jgi:protein-disulfide isomerase